jgi:hypothetical protein
MRTHFEVGKNENESTQLQHATLLKKVNINSLHSKHVASIKTHQKAEK